MTRKLYYCFQMFGLLIILLQSEFVLAADSLVATDVMEIDAAFITKEKGLVTVGKNLIPMGSARQWLATDDIHVNLGVQDINDGVFSFWLMPLADPVTTQIQFRYKNKALCPRLRDLQNTELVWGGDLKRKQHSLAIKITREGQVTANHLSWHNDSQWLDGLSSEQGIVKTGQWVHIAYGVGKKGQRLWINGQLVAHNPKATQSISWPYNLQFKRMAALIANVQLLSDHKAMVDIAKAPDVDMSRFKAPNIKALYQLLCTRPERQQRLNTLMKKHPAMPYELARFNVISRLAPLTFFSLLMQTHSPAPKGLDIDALAIDEAQWLLETQKQWDQQIDAIEQGKVQPMTTPTIRPVTKSISIKDGAFWQDGRPVFFVGLQDLRSNLMQGLGLTFSGHTVGPRWEMPREGKLAGTGKGQSKNAQRAAEQGYFWDILYSGHVFPKWARKKYPYLNVGTGFMSHDQISPKGWSFDQITLESILPDLQKNTNILSIDLANEPAFNGKTIDSEENWRNWLKKKHRNIATLNKHWKTQFINWEQIKVPHFVHSRPVEPWHQTFPTDAKQLRVYMDWSQFNLQRVNNWYAKAHRLVKNYLPETYTYTKMIQSAPSNARMGIDIVANVRTTDLNGTDSWWVFTGYKAEDESHSDQMSGSKSSDKIYSVNWTPSLHYYDLLTSANTAAPATNAEFHLFSDGFNPMTPEHPKPGRGHWERPLPWEHFYAGVWQQAIYGQAMSNIWLHWPRNNVTERPQALDAISRVSMDLNRLAEQVHAFQQAQRPVGVLWGLSPILADTSGKWHATVNNPWLSMWQSIAMSGLRARYVFERDLEANKIPNVKVLLIYSYSHISLKALEGLKVAQKAGVKIWVLDPAVSLALDPYGDPHDKNLLPKYDRVLDQRVFEADPLSTMRHALKQYGLLPDVQVFVDNAPSRKVQCLSTRWQGKTLVNLCNYARENKQVQLRGLHGKQVVDLITGQSIIPDQIPMKVEQVRLLEIR